MQLAKDHLVWGNIICDQNPGIGDYNSHLAIPMEPLLWKRIPIKQYCIFNVSTGFCFNKSHGSYELQLPSGVLLAAPAAVAFGAGDMYRTSFPGREEVMFLVMSLGKGRSFGKMGFGKPRQWCLGCEVYD